LGLRRSSHRWCSRGELTQRQLERKCSMGITSTGVEVSCDASRCPIEYEFYSPAEAEKAGWYLGFILPSTNDPSKTGVDVDRAQMMGSAEFALCPYHNEQRVKEGKIIKLAKTRLYASK
jgi:hypothetical protein